MGAANARWSVDFPHERVVITGGGSGIGRAVALELSRIGVDSYVLGRREQMLDETVSMAAGNPGAVRAIRCDVRDPAAVDAAFGVVESDGVATGLLHGAAHVSMMEARSMTPEQFAEVVGSTLLGSFNVVRRWADPLLRDSIGGAAVMMTSNLASRGTPGIAHSSSGKAGVEALVKSLGREWGPFGITLNAIGPGPFPVEKSAALWSDPKVRERMSKEVALGRYGELREIVAPIMFMLSAGAAFTTGQCLAVDGGMSLSHWPVPPEELAAGLNNQYEPAAR